MNSWSRRGVLPPQIQTHSSSNSGSAPHRNTSSSNSPSRTAFSPTFASHHNSNSRNNISRNSSVSSTSSPFSPSSSNNHNHVHHSLTNHQGVQQQTGNQLLYSSRSGRTIPSSSHSHLPSAVTSLAQGGASGDGGGSSTISGSNSKPRLSRASPSLSSQASAADIGSPQPQSATSAPYSASGGLASIDIAQVSIQLARLDKEKDPRKLEDGIRALGAFISHDMGLTIHTMRKLIKQHASRIFGNENSQDVSGTWMSLQNEVEAIRTKPDQAKAIADAIDVNEGEPFRDFDVSTFMERFKLDPVAKCMLALALKTASKPDLKTKADAILSNNLEQMFMTILNPSSDTGDDLTPTYLAALIDRLLQKPPRNWNEESLSNLHFTVQSRYQRLGGSVPNEVMSTMLLAELTSPSNELVRLVQRTGDRATSSLESCKDMLQGAPLGQINYTQVASVLLYMVITANGEMYNPAIFVQALKDHRAGKRLDWQDVVHAFDREGLVITKQQFLALYNALLPLAQEYENFDIQLLWGGSWSQIETQLSFVVAFLSCTADELSATDIPRLRRAFTIESFEGASDEVKEYAAQAVRHPLVSLDATSALFKMIFQDERAYKHAIDHGIPEAVINPHTPYFVVAAAAVAQPWGGLQDRAFDQLFYPFLKRQLEGYSFVLHGLWAHDAQALAQRLVRWYTGEPPLIKQIYEHSIDHGWLLQLTQIPNEFAIDLACFAHGHGDFDIESWLTEAYERNGGAFPAALANFVEGKARADITMQKEPGASMETFPLAIDTAFSLLTWLGRVLGEDILIPLNRIAIGAYPRLINYGEGFDAIIREDSKNGNAISPEADAAMQDHFKQLYNRETDVKTMIEGLQRYKNSEDPGEQELFACMIQGLFDEYSCFGEYPPDALATTAVLFGSIINFNLLSSIALQAGLSMVLEALQTATSREDKMYKFGLQALIHFQGKLVDWPSFCEKLLAIPELNGTEVFRTADEIVRSRIGVEGNGEIVTTNGLTNGFTEVVATGGASEPFNSLNIDPPLRPEIYQEPDEEIQDRVIFAVNNLSDRNLDEKFHDIQDSITDQYHQWFALHLVEDRAKSQPNYHDLFLKLLGLFDDSWLWREVIRETIVSCVRLLNADATNTNSSDRTQLKNLGTWLGRLTIARDKPVKKDNIDFVALMVEAHKTKRLPVVVPFVCRVLKAVVHSKTFNLPNPWTEDILKVLLELYHHIEVKLALKFEVEVLCTEIGIDTKKIEPSVVLREADFGFDDVGAAGGFPASVPDGLEGFNDLTLANFSRQNTRLGERFTPAAIISSLPDISGRLFYPQLSYSSAVTQEQTRTAFLQAAEQAIREIIFPVVERSVTIAGISASQLVMKDFATEPDEEKFRKAAHSMVKSLAGSLALVTCREPLRMSMTNNIRQLARGLPGEGLAEGAILMFVNDNIDVVCKVVEEAAERQSVAVIDDAIEQGLVERQHHHQQADDTPFQWPTPHKYARMMPEPYRPSENGQGLTPQQLAIYENFGPTRAGTNHVGGQDARAQLPDFDGGIASLPTPAGEPAVPRQGGQGARDMGDSRMNGYSSNSPEELFEDLVAASKAASEESLSEVGVASPARDAAGRFLQAVRLSPAAAALHYTASIAQYIWSGRLDRRVEVELFAELLLELCRPFNLAGQQVWQYVNSLDDETLLANPKATIAMLSRTFLDSTKIDRVVANAIANNEPRAFSFLSELLDAVVLSDIPFALRADFAGSIEMLSQAVAQDPSNELGQMLLVRLNHGNADVAALTPPATKEDEYENIFREWIARVSNDAPEKQLVAFVQQMYKRNILQDFETTTNFFRACITYCVYIFETEEEHRGQLDRAYLPIDAFAHLISTLVLYQGEPEGAVKPTKAAYLDNLLSILIAIQLHHVKERQEHANHKVFFRFYSDLFYDVHHLRDKFKVEEHDEMILVLAKMLQLLSPAWFPGFTMNWLGLVGHRFFVRPVLTMAGQDKGNDAFVSLMELILKHANFISPTADNPRNATAFIVAILRLLLMLHHDYPVFLMENAARLCAATPQNCTQVRNLINHVAPRDMVVPDPFTTGLQLERMDEMKQTPVVRIDLAGILQGAGLQASLDQILKDKGKSTSIAEFAARLEQYEVDQQVMQAVALYVATEAITAAGAKGQIFNKSLPHFKLLQAIANDNLQVANTLINAMVNQLRYPNAHTYYVTQVLLEIFARPVDGASETKHNEVRELIATVLLERLMPMRPHPWGLVICFMELVKNQEYDFQMLPFVREHEEIWTRPRGLEPLNAGPPGMGMSGF